MNKAQKVLQRLIYKRNSYNEYDFYSHLYLSRFDDSIGSLYAGGGSVKKNTTPYDLFNWGPILCRIKINPSDLKKYVELCSKKTSSVNEKLAGLIKHEHYIDIQKYEEILNPYISIFYKAFKHWYGLAAPAKVLVRRAWVNFMVAGEFNPPHIHANCDFSSVLFVKIPEELKEEHKKFTGTGGGPGALSFFHGGSQNFSICYRDFLPEEGSFYIFPAALRHFVSPFTSKGERISISANFTFDINRNTLFKK